MTITGPKAEEPARELLGHAIRGELRDLSAAVQAAGSDRYRQVLGLCLGVAAYIAVDVSGRWPTDADAREIARVVVGHETEVPLDEEAVYDYLSGAALGFKPLPQALGGQAAAVTLPLLITGSMLYTFKPQGREWWDYLDQIQSAYKTAENTDLSVLPALQVRAQILKQTAGRGETG